MCLSGPAWNLPEPLLALVRAGDEPLVAEIIVVFREDTAQRLQQLQQAFEAGEAGAFRAQAHAIKGSASQVGAELMASCCREIEYCTAAGQTASLAPLLDQLHREFREVSQAMAAHYGL